MLQQPAIFYLIKRWYMLFGYYQQVHWRPRTAIIEGHYLLVLIDNIGASLSAHYLAKSALNHTRHSKCHGAYQ
jgi:hypothetical protein